MSEFPDEDTWLRELELRASKIEQDLMGWQQRWRPSAQTDRSDPSRPSDQEVWDFVHHDLIPRIDVALAAYRAGDSTHEMLTWQVGPSTANVSIIANANGVLIDSSMPWFMRKLYSHYAHLGYKVEALNHPGDATMLEPTEVRITR